MSLRTLKKADKSSTENMKEMIVPDVNESTNDLEGLKQFSTKTPVIVSGLCKSLKNANKYRLRIQEELKYLLRKNSLRNKKD